MPTTLTEGTAWSASVQVPNDGEAANQASILPTFVQPLTDRTKYLVNRVGGSADSLEWAYPTPRTRQITYPAQQYITPVDTGFGVPTIKRSNQLALLQSNSEFYALEIPRIPNGGTLTEIKILAKQGATRTALNRLRLDTIIQRSVNWTTAAITAETTILASPGVEINNSTVYEFITHSASPIYTADNDDKTYYALIKSGSDAATNNDVVESFRLTFTDPGPRNF